MESQALPEVGDAPEEAIRPGRAQQQAPAQTASQRRERRVEEREQGNRLPLPPQPARRSRTRGSLRRNRRPETRARGARRRESARRSRRRAPRPVPRWTRRVASREWEAVSREPGQTPGGEEVVPLSGAARHDEDRGSLAFLQPDQVRRRRAPLRARPGGDARGSRRLEQVRRRELDAEPVRDERERLDRRERVAAESEEVVVRPDPVEAERAREDGGRRRLVRVAGGAERPVEGRPGPSGSGSAARSIFPRGRAGQPVEEDEHRRDPVSGQARGESAAQRPDRPADPAPRDTTQAARRDPPAAAAPRPRPRRCRRTASRAAFDLADLDAVPADLQTSRRGRGGAGSRPAASARGRRSGTGARRAAGPGRNAAAVRAGSFQ